MSPERINGEHYSYSADIWALGLTCLYLSIGRYPIPLEESNGYWGVVGLANGNIIPESPPEGFSQEFSHFVCECMRLNPNLRPSADKLLKHPFLNKRNSNSKKLLKSPLSTHEAIKSYENCEFSLHEMEDILCTNHTDDWVQYSKPEEGRSEAKVYSWFEMWNAVCIEANNLPMKQNIHDNSKEKKTKFESFKVSIFTFSYIINFLMITFTGSFK